MNTPEFFVQHLRGTYPSLYLTGLATKQDFHCSQQKALSLAVIHLYSYRRSSDFLCYKGYLCLVHILPSLISLFVVLLPSPFLSFLSKLVSSALLKQSPTVLPLSAQKE